MSRLTKIAPQDRRGKQFVMQLAHARQTGQFPHLGGLYDQPAVYFEWYSAVQEFMVRTDIAR